MKNNKLKLEGVALSALFAAIICVLSQISILTPVGVPLTLQIFGIALCGFVLGAKMGIISVACYILVGLIGIPVFSGFKGGIHTLFGLTGGFIVGFLAVAFLCGVAKTAKKIYLKVVLSCIGVTVCHILGVLQLAAVSKSTVASAFVTASLPFILKDVLLTFAAYLVAKLINKRLKIN